MSMKMFGDRKAFSIGYTLVSDPDELYPSWGSFSIWVNGRKLTRGLLPDGTALDDADVPLLPIAEWFVEQWDAFFHETRLPWRDRRAMTAAQWIDEAFGTLDFAPGDDLFERIAEVQAYRARHAYGTALPGYRLPDLVFRRLEDQMEVSWTDSGWRSVDSGIRLLEPSGAILISKADLAASLLSWLTSLAQDLVALPASEADGTRLMRSISSLSSSNRDQARLSWLIGDRVLANLDPAHVDSMLLHRSQPIRAKADMHLEPLIYFVSTNAGSHRSAKPKNVTPYLENLPAPFMLFKSTNPDISKGDVHKLWDEATRTPVGEANELRVLARPELAWGTGREVTADGYDKAVELRDSLEISPEACLTGSLDLETDLLPRLGIKVKSICLEDKTIEGAAVWQTGHLPTIFINENGRFSATTPGRRMTLAHELCHLLFDLDSSGQVGLVSNPWAEYALERRANAFAAMLLMPEAAVSAALPTDPDTWTTTIIRDAMTSLGVSTVAFMRHLENIGFIDSTTRDYWMTALTTDFQ